MFTQIRWTRWSEDHIARHGVLATEVDEAVLSKPILVESGRNGCHEMYGTTNAGRYLLVITRWEPSGDLVVVTARDMNSQEKRRFKKRAH